MNSDSSHPLMWKLDAIRHAGAALHQIGLAPLTREDLTQLVGDALHCDAERAAPLAHLVREKTGGNPFFVIQFLYALAEEGLLHFDHDEARWSWDLNRIHATGYTDNVVELMAGKLTRLPAETQKAVQQLACVGNTAEFTTLAIAFGTSEQQVHADLSEAVRLELVERLKGSYKFVHDRVQEAAYSLIPEASRAPAHLRIGRLLVAHTCLSRKPEALHKFDFLRVPPHAGAADSSIFRHGIMRRLLILIPVISALLACVVGLFRSRASLCLEHLALRHQLAIYQQTVHRPRLHATDRLFWAWLSRLWPAWQDALAFVQPRTVIAWQRQRFRDHWRQLSQPGTPGRPAVTKEVRQLIRDMWQANPTWGSPRIVGELRKIGIDATKSTVEKYRMRPPKPPSPTWKSFLTNHIQDLVALDFFVVPTVRHTVLFVLLILAHDRRRVVHFNVTEHPTAEWTAQQIIEAFPWDEAPRYLLRDRDHIYGAYFRQRVRHMGIEEVLIAPKSPWQNPYVERLIGSIRRECLDHVIILHERHLRRLLTEYFSYYHHWRTHRALAMDCPVPRPVQRPEHGLIWEVPEVGGLPHHYERQVA